MQLIPPVFPPQQCSDVHTRRRTLTLPDEQNAEKVAVRFKQDSECPFHFRSKNQDVCAMDFFSFYNLPPSFCLAHLLALLPGSKAVKKNRGKPPEYQLTAATDVKS